MLLTRGPIESVDVKTGSITVLGQTYRSQANSSAVSSLAGRLSTGETVIVDVVGQTRGGEIRSSLLQPVSSMYVPGSSLVYVTGKITASNPATGSFAINGLKVDYSSLATAGAASYKVGQTVTVAGTQPAPRSVLIASKVVAIR